MPKLSDLSSGELEVVLDLLGEESRNLPAEIHHTQTPGVKDQLHARLKTIERLLEKLRQPAGQ